MNWKRVGRLLVCLVLVFCLIVNVSPIRAKAVSPGVAFVGVSVLIGIIAVVQGIGVRSTAGWMEDTTNDFNSVINRCKEYLAMNTDHITDEDKILLYATGNPDLPYMVKQSLIDDIRSWLFGEGEVLSSGLECSTSHYLASTLFALSDISTTVPTYVCWYTADGRIYESVYSLSENFYLTCGANKGWASSYGSVCAYTVHTSYDGDEQLSSMYLGDFSEQVSDDTYAISYVMTNVVGSIENKVTTTKDLTLGEIFPGDIALAEGYTEWSAGSRVVTNDQTGEDETYYPIGIGQTASDTAGISQEDIWVGNSTYVDSSTDTDTGTSSGTAADVVTGVVSGLQDQTAQLGVWLGELIAGVQAIPQAIADVLTAIFVPSADYVTAKVESLRARFPFISSVISTGESLRDSISGSSGPPAIYVDLGRASSGNYGSQKVLLTDFAWYAEYKPTVDAVLSAALWAFFGWRVFLKLPGIISGESGVVGDISARVETYNKIKAGPPTKK